MVACAVSGEALLRFNAIDLSDNSMGHDRISHHHICPTLVTMVESGQPLWVGYSGSSETSRPLT